MVRAVKTPPPAWAISRKCGDGYRVDFVWRRAAAPSLRGMVSVGFEGRSVVLRPVQAGGYGVHKYGESGKLSYVRVGLPSAIATEFDLAGTATDFRKIVVGKGEVRFTGRRKI